MKINKKIIIGALCFAFGGNAAAQAPKELKFNLDETGKTYIKLNVANQVWLRYTENNPGSVVNPGANQGVTASTANTSAYGEANTVDAGIRRIRLQLSAQISERMFMYIHFGQNNLGYTTPRFTGAFFHDATIEYKAHLDGELTIGGGLTGWSGPLRYSQAGFTSILTLDLPVYQEFTNGVSDQFLRKLGIYAKGKLGKLDYRVLIAKPMMVQDANTAIPQLTNNTASQFAYTPSKLQTNAYFMYQFFDKENNLVPYTTGCYLGQKRVFNIGAGMVYQPKAMWQATADATGKVDTAYHNMFVVGADVFYDTPLNKEKGTAFTAYAAYSHQDFGTNYYRNAGAMNPMTANISKTAAGGAGNAYPITGTGNTFYVQTGWLMKKGLLPDNGTLQPFAAVSSAQLQAIKSRVNVYEIGVNWLIHGTHNSKISLEYQNRGVYNKQSNGDITETSRKGMVVMQLQLGI